jgi:hypothetical protein
LEYASSIWSPYKKKDIETIENVQKRATRMLPQMKNLNHEERLKLLKMPTLKFRRMRGDMIEAFKILTRLYDSMVTEGMLDIRVLEKILIFSDSRTDKGKFCQSE